MADLEHQPQVETQNQEDLLNSTPIKDAKVANNQEALDQTVETEAQSPSQPQEQASPAESPVKEEIIHQDPAEVQKNLRKLHEKVDEILHKHQTPLYKSHFLPNTYFVGSLRNSAISHHDLGRHSHSGLSHLEHRPRYDEQKLDEIVGRILGVSYVPARLSHVERTSYKQAPAPVKTVQKPAVYYCSEAENDVDSLILEHIKSVGQEVEENHQNYNNFYVGSLHDDIDDQPRTKRIGRRQQLAQAKRQADNNELLKKSVYDQRVNQKASNEQAKKALAASGYASEDFDFARAQNVKRA